MRSWESCWRSAHAAGGSWLILQVLGTGIGQGQFWQMFDMTQMTFKRLTWRFCVEKELRSPGPSGETIKWLLGIQVREPGDLPPSVAVEREK